MDELSKMLHELIGSKTAMSVMKAVLVLVAGLFLARTVPPRLGLTRLHPQGALLLRVVTRYALLATTAVVTLKLLGIDLSVLVGAAGFLTVAVGFAAQTSASNLISGMFLMGERPFVVGDVIKIEDVTGEVLSIDPLAVKLRTLDNLQVRIPNEAVLKSNVVNLTAFPIRRLDLRVGVAYKEDLHRVKSVLAEIPRRIPICLEEPKPQILFLGFGDSAIDIQFSVWSTKENFVELRNLCHEEIKAAFQRAGIEIPFPHRALVASSDGAPITVKVVEG